MTTFIGNSGSKPLRDSPAAKEILRFRRPESVETAFSIAALSYISATDYLEATDILVCENRSAIAPYVCARAMIESSAVCVWLGDMKIGVNERVGRSFAIRYSALEQQKKMARYTKDDGLLGEIENRIVGIEKIALKLGYSKMVDKKGKRSGIGQNKPNITSLIEKQFQGEAVYRLLSGVAHSQYTTLTSLCFSEPISIDERGAFIRRITETHGTMSLVSLLTPIYAKCFWIIIRQFGYNATKASVLLEKLYDHSSLPDSNQVRFWRTVLNNI